MPVFQIADRKIKADSKEKAQYLYDKEWGSGAKKPASSSKSSTSSSSTPSRTNTPSVPAPSTSSYSGGSIVDFLRSTGQNSDFSSRAALAAKQGIAGYKGSADQNNALLAAIRGRATTPTPTSPRDTFVSSTREGLANASNLSATTPESTQKKVSSTPDYRQQYVDFISKMYPSKDVADARETLTGLTKRIADTTLMSRREEDRIRENEAGALARGVDAQLIDNQRVTTRQLGDLGIAASPLEALLENAEGGYRTLANLTPEAKAGDPLGALSTKGALTSGNLNYTREDYTEDSTALENSRGTDGWVDPSVYQTLYKNWITSGGVADDFVDLYPPERYANPANDWLPGVLRNGSGGTARTQVVEVGGRRVLINADTGETIRDLGVALGTGGDSGWGF